MVWPVFQVYMSACGGSASCLLIVALFVLNVGSSAFCHWWLSYWINQGSGVRLLLSASRLLLFPALPLTPLSPFPQNTTVTLGNNSALSISMRDNPMMQQYAAIYASSMGVMLLFKLIRGVAFVKVRVQPGPLRPVAISLLVKYWLPWLQRACCHGVVFVVSPQGTLRASSKLHDELFHKILRCPMKLFDTTPTGRLLNRFSKDMDEGDGGTGGSALPFGSRV